MTAPADGTSTPERPAGPPADRYGRAATPRRRLLARAGVAALAVAGVALVLWIGLGAAATPVRWEDVGYRVDGSSAVEVTFDVIMEPGSTATCRVQALSQSHAEVGVQTVDIGAARERTQRVTTTVPTAEAAVTGVVHSCEAD